MQTKDTVAITEQQEENDEREKLTRVSVFLLLSGIPLFMTNKYFNITLSKFLFFAVISAMCFMLSGTLKPEGEKRLRRKKSLTDIAVYGLVFSAAISVAISSYPLDALFGSSGRCMGLIFYLILLGLYITLSRYYVIHKSELLGYIGAFVVVAFLAFLQFFGVNVFGLYNNLSEETIATYYSTIGNINVVSSYICLCLPFLMVVFCCASGMLRKILSGVLCFAGFCFLIIANSDSGYIGIFAAFCAVAFYLSLKGGNLSSLFILAAEFFISPWFMYRVAVLSEGKTKSLSAMAIMLGKNNFMLFAAITMLIVSSVFYLLKNRRSVYVFTKWASVVLFVSVAVCVFSLIYYFTFINTEKDLGAFEGYLRFNDAWATSRGHIWRMTMESYERLPFIKKLFGCGTDTLLLLLKEGYNQEMLSMGAYTDNAHNEFMNYLVNNGIAGLAFYILLLVSAMLNCIKKFKKSQVFGALFAVIVSYACQSVVNISQPLTTPFYFVLIFMSCCNYSSKNFLKEKTKEKTKEKMNIN